MKDTTSLGDLTEWEVALALTRAGKKLLRPASSASRFDLAIDNGDGSITRVQCKTGQLKRGFIVFRLYSMSGHRGTQGRPYSVEVDAYGVYCPATKQAFLVPVAALAGQTGSATLRVAPALNGQRKRTRRAEDFLI